MLQRPEMELKVWVEGIQRIVCGVTETTTCQEVVFALAVATGKSGRFTLIERWRNNERQLAPNENPMKILMKWGEYSSDVQFILQWSQSQNTPSKPSNITIDSPQKQKLAASADNVGIVKGVPHEKPHLEVRASPQNSPKKQQSPSHRPAPPPYRDPPPPRKPIQENKHQIPSDVLYNAQYRDLITMINYQRETLSNQQADLTKYDAEIVYWESKEREKQMQLDYITQELIAASTIAKSNQDQIQLLSYVEEESEIVKQQEKTLKSEITLLRSKLANCETELLQCKNKIRLVMDEIQMEQRSQCRRTESRKQLEKGLLMEMERLQKDVELAKQSTDLHHLTAETLKKEVAALETAIIEKKRQVEMLVHEMKEANLESLTIAPPEDTRAVFEGPRVGSARKMVGSPRQLENAVPTNKNPHGVWV